MLTCWIDTARRRVIRDLITWVARNLTHTARRRVIRDLITWFARNLTHDRTGIAIEFIEQADQFEQDRVIANPRTWQVATVDPFHCFEPVHTVANVAHSAHC